MPAAMMVKTAPTGSTAPDNTPYRNDFPLPMPRLLNGMDIIAPSGKFCIAIPTASAIADISVIPEFPLI